MNVPPSLARIQELFLAAVALPSGERAAFLAAQCAGDEALHAAVLGLLRSDEDASLFADDRLAAVREQLTGPRVAMPEHIADFELLEPIGQGGMGVVYRARQRNPEREVALKVLLPGSGGADARARFALETAALGRLQHAGIAQIFASGSYASPLGEQPWLAMELVRGESLDRWAARTRPDRDTALRLVLEIGDAVQHAHQRGLIHRDLKPGNVFVDGDGRAKVLDFGIARLVDEERDRTLRTQTGQLLGTLAYMSPEQASGDPDRVDVRTDVYALAAVGYELLSGQLPVDVAGASFPDALRRLAEDEPRPLGEHARHLAGDLQTIFAQALRKEPDRRYASMQAFTDDLRRFLAHQPVQARPATASYLLARFARRHRGVVAGIVVAAAALVAGTTLSVAWALRADAAAIQADASARRAVAAEAAALTAAERASAAERKARAEADLANQVTQFVEGLFTAAAPEMRKGRTYTLRDLVDRGITDVRTSLADQPLLRARLLRLLGTVLSGLGDAQEAVRLLDDALGVCRDTLPDADPLILEVMVAKAQTLFLGRQVADAAVLFDESMARHRRHGMPQDSLYMRIREGLGACALDQRRTDVALEHFTEVQRLRAGDPDPDVRAGDLVRLANVHNQRGDHERAETLFGAAHELLQQGDDPALAALVATNLGVLRVNQDRLDEAEVLFREALARGEQQLGPDHPSLVRRLCNVAAILSNTERPAEAVPLLERALAIAERSGLRIDDGLANVLVNLGNARRATGQPREAVPLYERAATIYEQLVGARSPDRVQALEAVAATYDELGESARAAEVRSRIPGGQR
jgi:eukaryotic-like serine/threonine-protein kinase